MNDSLSDRLRTLVRSYLDGAVDFVALWDGFFAMLPELHSSGSVTSVELADKLMVHLMDYDEGDTTLADFRASLDALVAPMVAVSPR